MPKPVFFLNGPNLDLLGTREPQLYGSVTLPELEKDAKKRAAELGLSLVFRQSNDEGEIVSWVHEAINGGGGIVINPGGFTTTSVAILDALKAFKGPVIELHVTNIHKRESFRQHSYISLAATCVIAGLGPQGYVFAVDAIAHLIKARG